MLDRVLAVLRGRADELRGRGILRAWVFGSVARREDHAASDVDLIFEADRGVQTFDIMDLEESLEADLGREVNISTLGGLNTVRHADIFRDMKPAF